MHITGSCHCRNITFALDWHPEPTEIPARACSCSFCTRHGNVWTANPAASLRINIQDPARISMYAFGTEVARFHICTTCGVVPVVTSEIDGKRYAVVNVNTFENVDLSLLRHASANFDGETEEKRLARQKRNWIGDVTYEGTSP